MGKYKEWRKILKKLRRKRIRTNKAKERDQKLLEEERKRAESPTYQIWLREQEELDRFKKENEEWIRAEQHKKWLEEEEKAQEIWRQQQKRLQKAKAEKAKQELLIREEWESEQKRILEEAEKQRMEKERKEREQAELQEQIEKYVRGDCDELPECAKQNHETRPGETVCPFFEKVGACRYGDQCSRNHIYPAISNTLLFPGFFTYFGMVKHNNSEYDTDIHLEYEDSDTYEIFLDFYEDVLNELKNFGAICQFKVCCNVGSHLKGNVYVQYKDQRNAIKAFRALQGRYYAGKQISVEFCNIQFWKRAICGLFSRKKCPKADKCNFLHVFRNPRCEFIDADFDRHLSPLMKASKRKTEYESTDWRWTPSPERSPEPSKHLDKYRDEKCESRTRSHKFSHRHATSHLHSEKSSSRNRHESSRRSKNLSRSPCYKSRSKMLSQSPNYESKSTTCSHSPNYESRSKTASQSPIHDFSNRNKDCSTSSYDKTKIKRSSKNRSYETNFRNKSSSFVSPHRKSGHKNRSISPHPGHNKRSRKNCSSDRKSTDVIE